MTVLWERPKFATDEMLKYLDDLSESDSIDIYDAIPTIKSRFKLRKREAEYLVDYWFGIYCLKNGLP